MRRIAHRLAHSSDRLGVGERTVGVLSVDVGEAELISHLAGLDHLAGELAHVLFGRVHQRGDRATRVGGRVTAGEIGVLGDTSLRVERHRKHAELPELAGHVVMHLVKRSLARAIGHVGEVHDTSGAADAEDQAGLVLDHHGCDVVAHDVREPDEVVHLGLVHGQGLLPESLAELRGHGD